MLLYPPVLFLVRDLFWLQKPLVAWLFLVVGYSNNKAGAPGVGGD